MKVESKIKRKHPPLTKEGGDKIDRRQHERCLDQVIENEREKRARKNANVRRSATFFGLWLLLVALKAVHGEGFGLDDDFLENMGKMTGVIWLWFSR